jgi:hypothetical protein
MSITEMTRPTVHSDASAAPWSRAPEPVAPARRVELQGDQLREHMQQAHGRTAYELLVIAEHMHDLHRFEHFEASVGLVTVDHDHDDHDAHDHHQRHERSRHDQDETRNRAGHEHVPAT